MNCYIQEQLGALLKDDNYEKDDFTVVSQPFLQGVELPYVRLTVVIMRSINYATVSLHNRRAKIQISPILLQTVSIFLPNRRQSQQGHSGIIWYSVRALIRIQFNNFPPGTA